MSGKPVEVAFGAGFFGNAEPWISDKDLAATYDLLQKYDIKKLDSAQLYGESENRLGETKAGKRFAIDTKWQCGWNPGSANKDNIIATAQESAKKIGSPIEVFYLHCPDAQSALEDTLAGVNEAHQLGLFQRFGMSNFSAAEVTKAYEICKANKYVLPTVFQGNYAPVARRLESELFPTLRKLGISFSAYSPLAGGFLTKTKEQVTGGAGRFNTNFMNGMYDDMYVRPAYLDVLEKWEALANEQGCTRAELAYRWVAYHSFLKREHGDAMIIGASKFEQVELTLKGIRNGPLKSEVVDKINKFWDVLQHEAPLDAFSK